MFFGNSVCYSKEGWLWFLREDELKGRRRVSRNSPYSPVIQQVPYPIANISAQPTQIVLVSKRGDIITLDRDLNISNELSRDDNGDLFLRSFSYPAARCAFLPNDIQPLGEILALFLARKGTIRVRVVHLDQGGGVVQIASVELSFDTVSRIQPMAALVLSFCR